MAEGISPNPLNKISQVYLDRIAKINSDPEIAQKEREKWQTEAKVDTGSAEEKATARNKRNTPPGKDYKFDTSVFITRKPGESLESARTRKRRDAHAAKRGVKEGFSSWRNDLREIVDEIESEAEKKVQEKKGIKNKVVINPKLTETVENMGGRLLEVKEIEEDAQYGYDEKGKSLNPKDDDNQKAEALKKKEAMLKKRIVRMKMQAVNQGAGENIIAGYEPDIEGAVEYFYEEGINEEGIDLLIEEIGLEEFVDFVEGGGAVELNEERKARKMNVRTKAKLKKDVEAIKADKSDVVKTGPKDTLARARTERAFKKRKLAKPSAPKKEAPKPVAKKAEPKPAPKKKAISKPVAKKVERAVAKVKPTQPKKPASKEGLRDKIKSAYKAGVKRHRKATQPVRVFHKGMKAGAKKTVKFAKDVKKAVVGEEVVLEKDLNAAERRALPDKDFALPGKGKGPEGKQAGSYPIPDKNHARMALAMVAKHGTPEKKAKVRAAVAKKFPGIQQEDYDSQKKKEVLDAMKRQGRKLTDKEKEKIAAKVVKDKGDTSKSDDRYAYESVVRPKGQDSDKEVNKATRKAAFRPFANTKPPKLKNVAEDKALELVRQQIIKKHGKGAIYDPKNPPKAQPRSKAKPDTRTPEQKKRDQEEANIDAQYGGRANRLAGRGLGT